MSLGSVFVNSTNHKLKIFWEKVLSRMNIYKLLKNDMSKEDNRITIYIVCVWH